MVENVYIRKSQACKALIEACEQVYFKGSLVKVEIGLARGKKLYDKRDDLAKKDAKREIDRAFKARQK